MRDMQKQVAFPMQHSRRKYIVIPLVNHLLILSLKEGRNKHILLPQYRSLNFISL